MFVGLKSRQIEGRIAEHGTEKLAEPAGMGGVRSDAGQPDEACPASFPSPAQRPGDEASILGLNASIQRMHGVDLRPRQAGLAGLAGRALHCRGVPRTFTRIGQQPVG
jgi:hypothetical protein